MYKKLTESEIEFCEHFYDPCSLIENLIPENFDAPNTWSVDSECFKIRNYQFAMLSYECMYADDDNLTPRQNFLRKKGAGDLYNISARNLGKSLVGMDLDAVISPCYYLAGENCLASFDSYHLKERTERVANIIEGHKFFEIYHLSGQKKTINRGHSFSIRCRTGYKLLGVNENISGKNIGKQFHGKHYQKLWYDEISYTTEEGEKKRVDSGHSNGHIERLFGIPDLKVGSPLGKILSDYRKSNWICRLPQYVREDWDEIAKEKAIEKYNGKNSIGYKLNVEGSIIEGAFGKFDIERIRTECYTTARKIKRFDIDKNTFSDFKDIIIIDRIPSKQIFVCADIGSTGSPTEIIIIFGEAKRYKYRYNISLYKLTSQEQAEIFKWIYDELGTTFIALDCTGGDGRAVADELVLLGVPNENIIRCSFSSKMVIDFMRDSDGKVILDEKGKPLEKTEKVIDWACQRLEYLFYNGYIDIPIDEKFLHEFSGYFELPNGKKGSSTTDHLLQAFQCFAIGQWTKETEDLRNKKRISRVLGVIG